MNKKLISILLVLCMMLTLLVQAGCTPEKNEGSTPESTPVGTPTESTGDESTPTESPAESQPSESTPDGPIPPQSTPAESTEGDGKEETPPESTPPVGETYGISYDLDGGLAADGNPDSYAYGDGAITLLAPIRVGYVFAGWTGTGLSEPTVKVTIPANSYGDRAYKATWSEGGEIDKELKDPIADQIDGLIDSDKNTPKNPAELELSTTDVRGLHGEGVFLLKTAYTDIAVDGVMDAAYTYGIRFEMDMVQTPKLYENRDTGYNAYMIRTQDGKMHVFVEVIDHDIVINDEMWEFKWWHCDSWQMYVDFDNDRTGNDKLWTFAAEPTKKYLQENPENWVVVMTDDGFNIEFEFDNNGKPFGYGDEFSFGLFYNDTMNYTSTSKYDRSNTGTKSVLDPSFHLSNVAVQDAVKITSYPLTYDGDFDVDKITGEKTGDMLTDIGSGAASVAIVTSKYTSAYNEINAEELVKALAELGVRVQLIREDRLTDKSKFDYIIYSNTTADEGAAKAFATLNYAQYGAVIGEDAIYTFGWTWDGNDGMCDVILSLVRQAAMGDASALGDRYVYTLQNVRGEDIPKVDGTYCIIDSGEDAYIVVKQNTVIDDYNGYIAKLEAAGYKLHASNKMATVSTATYYTDDTVVNVLYSSADGDKTLRVVVENMAKTGLPTLEKEEYEPICESSVTQLDLGGGMCFIIKLDNGEFIIIDSGNQGRQEKIYNALLQLREGRGDIVVAAWILTHFHQDHIGGFMDFCENANYMKKVTIKTIMYNPPERFFLDISKKNSAGDRANIERWVPYTTKLVEGGTKIYQTRTGQKYYIGNAEIEIIGTFDDLAPFYVRADSSNHTSVHFTVTIEGQKLMFLGDATSPELLLAAKRYGDYLKCDIVQLAHHGYGDGGSDAAFYKAVNAPVVLHPGTGISGGAERWAADNAKKVYSYGSGNVTLELPHKIEE